MDNFLRSEILGRFPRLRSVLVILVSLKEFVGAVLFFFVLLRSLLEAPGVTVRYSITDLSPPFDLSLLIDSLNAFSEDTRKIRDAAKKHLISKELLRIDLENSRSEKVLSVDVRVIGVNEISAVGFRSTSAELIDSVRTIVKYTVSQESVLSFPRFRQIPAGGKVSLFVWGDFIEALLENNVKVSAANVSVVVHRAEQIEGLPLIIAKNLLPIALVVTGITLLVGLKRYSQNK